MSVAFTLVTPARPGRAFRPALPVAPAMPRPELRPDEAAIAGARRAPLTAEQRQRLAACARRAFDAQAAAGLADEDFDAWRHEQCREACGRGGIREMDQGCYGPSMAWFVALAGGEPRRREAGPAAKPAARDDADRARRALRDECARLDAAFGGGGAAEAYATALLSRIHRATWETAGAKQLWQVMFTMRNRSRSPARGNGPSRPRRSGGRPDNGASDKTHSRGFAGGLRRSAPCGGSEGRGPAPEKGAE